MRCKSTLNCSGELGLGIVYHISDIHVESREKVERAQVDHQCAPLVVVQLMVHITMF